MAHESADKATEPTESKVTTINQEIDTEEQNNQETGEPESNNCSKGVESNEEKDTNEVPKSIASKLTPSNLQDRIKCFLRTEIKQPTEKNAETDAASKINSEYYLDDECTEHFLPQQVDTCDVVGEMIQVIPMLLPHLIKRKKD